MYDEWIALRNELIFEASEKNFENRCDAAVIRLEKQLKDNQTKDNVAELVKNIAIDLQSYLPNWKLKGISRFALINKSEAFISLLEKYGYEEFAEEAKKQIHDFSHSRWIKLTEEKEKGIISNCWGNDNGLGTMEAMRRGASFVTTNPPIVNLARKGCPEVYDAVRDEINMRHADENIDQKVMRLTMQVVLNNCKALRPIYRITDGREGYVNFQVNPKNSNDANKMVTEIETVYKELTRLLCGKPNVVFKVPGTSSSLDVVQHVTEEGIGVNITVNFTVSQCQAFAKVIESGIADLSFVTIMSGRLDGPVCDDLKAANVENANQISKYASKLVTRRVYQDVLLKNHYRKVELLVASLRGPWNIYASIAGNERSRIIISSFPSRTEEWDALGRGEILTAMLDKVPEEIIKQLRKSDVFCKAYDSDAMNPEEFDTYKPVGTTLKEFINMYEELESYMT